jgi:hypothetical protein
VPQAGILRRPRQLQRHVRQMVARLAGVGADAARAIDPAATSASARPIPESIHTTRRICRLPTAARPMPAAFATTDPAAQASTSPAASAPPATVKMGQWRRHRARGRCGPAWRWWGRGAYGGGWPPARWPEPSLLLRLWRLVWPLVMHYRPLIGVPTILSCI